MAKYRKKPVVIEAFRLGYHVWPDWFQTAHAGGSVRTQDAGYEYDHNQITAEIETKEGIMFANDGDWIIKGVVGELYPCKPGVFAQTYEIVT